MKFNVIYFNVIAKCGTGETIAATTTAAASRANDLGNELTKTKLALATQLCNDSGLKRSMIIADLESIQYSFRVKKKAHTFVGKCKNKV